MDFRVVATVRRDGASSHSDEGGLIWLLSRYFQLERRLLGPPGLILDIAYVQLARNLLSECENLKALCIIIITRESLGSQAMDNAENLIGVFSDLFRQCFPRR